VENVAITEDQSNKILANQAAKDAMKIHKCMNKLARVMLELQILNIRHDVGAQRIDEILPMFSKAKTDLLENARQLIRNE